LVTDHLAHHPFDLYSILIMLFVLTQRYRTTRINGPAILIGFVAFLVYQGIFFVFNR
jgi:hypothetical protein